MWGLALPSCSESAAGTQNQASPHSFTCPWNPLKPSLGQDWSHCFWSHKQGSGCHSCAERGWGGGSEGGSYVTLRDTQVPVTSGTSSPPLLTPGCASHWGLCLPLPPGVPRAQLQLRSLRT